MRSGIEKRADCLEALEEELSIGSPKFRRVFPMIKKSGLAINSNAEKIFVSYGLLSGEKFSVVFDDPHGPQSEKGQAARWVTQLKKITKHAMEQEGVVAAK